MRTRYEMQMKKKLTNVCMSRLIDECCVWCKVTLGL